MDQDRLPHGSKWSEINQRRTKSAGCIPGEDLRAVNTSSSMLRSLAFSVPGHPDSPRSRSPAGRKPPRINKAKLFDTLLIKLFSIFPGYKTQSSLTAILGGLYL